MKVSNYVISILWEQLTTSDETIERLKDDFDDYVEDTGSRVEYDSGIIDVNTVHDLFDEWSTQL